MSGISYNEHGSGYPVVFIHGFCETQVIWDAYVEQLSSSYRIVTLDLPGFGKSFLPSNTFSIKDIANDVFELLTELNIKSAVVIGHSLGGYVTLELAKHHPELLDGFGLFHSTALADPPEKKDSRDKTIEFVEKNGVEVFATAFIPSLFFHKNRARLTETINNVVQMAAATSEASLVRYTEAMRDRHDRTDVLKSFANPILFIGGDKDTAVPIEKTSEQAVMPKRAIVNILKETGHMGMFEREEETLEIVTNFLTLCIKEH